MKQIISIKMAKFIYLRIKNVFIQILFHTMFIKNHIFLNNSFQSI